MATKLVRVNLLSEVLTLSWMGMGTMLVWSTRTRLKVDGSVETEVQMMSTLLEKSTLESLAGEETRMAVGDALSVLVPFSLSICWFRRVEKCYLPWAAASRPAKAKTVLESIFAVFSWDSFFSFGISSLDILSRSSDWRVQRVEAC